MYCFSNCPYLPIYFEIQIKTTLKYHLTQLEWPSPRNLRLEMLGRMWERDPCSLLVAMHVNTAIVEITLEVQKKKEQQKKVQLPSCDPVILLLCINAENSHPTMEIIGHSCLLLRWTDNKNEVRKFVGKWACLECIILVEVIQTKRKEERKRKTASSFMHGY